MFRFLIKTAIRAAEASYNTPERKGARGERRVHSAFSSALDEKDYRIMSDLILPVGSSTTQIDHVVLSRFGIFVIETKNMSGWIFGGSDQKSWTQVQKGGKKRRFQNPIFQNYAHVKAVEAALKVEKKVVHNFVVFVGSAEPKTVMPNNVAWSMQELGRLIGTQQEIVFSLTDLQAFAQKLDEVALENSRRVKNDHLRNLENRAEQGQRLASPAKISDPEGALCPRCNAPMVKRKNRKTGTGFLGCSQFPKCRGARDLG